MNRIVLGVDFVGHHEAALRLLARLRLDQAGIDCVSVVESPTLFPLERCEPRAAAVVFGRAAAELVSYAERCHSR